METPAKNGQEDAEEVVQMEVASAGLTFYDQQRETELVGAAEGRGRFFESLKRLLFSDGGAREEYDEIIMLCKLFQERPAGLFLWAGPCQVTWQSG